MLDRRRALALTLALALALVVVLVTVIVMDTCLTLSHFSLPSLPPSLTPIIHPSFTFTPITPVTPTLLLIQRICDASEMHSSIFPLLGGIRPLRGTLSPNRARADTQEGGAVGLAETECVRVVRRW